MTTASDLVAQAAELIGGFLPEHPHHVVHRSQAPARVADPTNIRLIGAGLHGDHHDQGTAIPGAVDFDQLDTF